MLTITAYDCETSQFATGLAADELPHLLADTTVYVWVDFDNPTPEENALLSDIFKFDPLAIEDCEHARQLPKLESFLDYHFFIVHGQLKANDAPTHSQVELDGFLGARYLVTYHMGEAIPAIRDSHRAIALGTSRLREGSSYLAYSILDHVIDMYLPILDHYDDELRRLEELFQQNRGDLTQDYLALSDNLVKMRRMSIRNQHVFYQFSHSELQFINEHEARLFRDIYDHVSRVVEMSEYYQQALQQTLNIYLTLNSNRLNEIMKYVAIISTVFMPMTLVTGIYGMNMDSLPLLHHPHSFMWVMLLMVAIGAGLIIFFKQRHWV